jgi:hypothetical protein
VKWELSWTAHNEAHVIPIGDIHSHARDVFACPCRPTVEIEGTTAIAIHHAFDRREYAEQPVSAA